MADLLVQRSYTYVGALSPTLFYYHHSCWEKAAPAGLAELPEDGVLDVARGTVRLVQHADIPFGIRCLQCEQLL